MNFSCGWSEKLAAIAWSSILLWVYFIVQSNVVIFVGSITYEVFFSFSLSSQGQQDLLASRRSRKAVFLPSIQTSLFLPPLKVNAATGIICTACHCGSYFPKDYCLWPLPLGQSWYHSRRPWLQRLTGRRGGNQHSPSNPHSLLWEWEDLLTGHHSTHCFSLSSISVSSLSHAHQAE